MRWRFAPPVLNISVRVTLLAVVCGLCASCDERPASRATPSTIPSSSVVVSASVSASAAVPTTRCVTDARVTPLQTEEVVVALQVAGHGDAAVSVPQCATGLEPVMIAAHGNGKRPEDICTWWRKLIADAGFILCPRGEPIGRSGRAFSYTSIAALRSNIDASLEALAKRYASYADVGGALTFVGLSLGADMGYGAVVQEPKRFARAVFVEGGSRAWTDESAKRFIAAGGDRVLIACGSASCGESSQRALATLTAAGVEAKRVYVEGAGHTR